MSTPVLSLPDVAPMGEPGPDAPPEAPKRRGRPPGSKDSTPRARKASQAADKAPRTATPSRTTGSLEKRIGSSLTTLGIGLALLSPKDGETVIAGVPALAKSLNNLAAQNPSVKANLERALTAGAWSGVLAAALPIGIGIAANHGMVPESVARMLSAAQADESNLAAAA